MASDPRYGGFNHAGVSYKHQVALTATKQVVALTAVPASATRSSAVPTFAQLKQINFEMDTIAGGCSKVTFYLSRDLAGDIPVTPTLSADVVFGFTTATKGSAIACLDYEYYWMQYAAETQGTVYLVVQGNVGTANVNVLLHWRG